MLLRQLGHRSEPSGPTTLATASAELLLQLSERSSAEALLAYCQLNRGEVAEQLERFRDDFVLPLRIESLTAEVLAETLDAVRTRGRHDIAREYAAIPRRCRRVVRVVVDECIGFVPNPAGAAESDPLADQLSERIDLPDELVAIAESGFHGPVARVIAAQTLLQFSRHDRRELLARRAPHREAPGSVAQSSSVARLLSRGAALDRFRSEIEHAGAWIRACRSTLSSSSNGSHE